jgi:hypothetical protein
MLLSPGGNTMTSEGMESHCAALGRRFKGRRKKKNGHPSNVDDFIRFGGMENIEYVAAAKAADEGKRFTREWWLPKLERWLAETETDDAYGRYCAAELRHEIDRLRRMLGICKSSEESRASTRERVRRHRERARTLKQHKGWQLRIVKRRQAPLLSPIF